GQAAVAASDGSSPAGAVTGAVGIGVWALLVPSRAARTSLAERPVALSGGGRRSDLWLAAAIGLFALAIGYGFPSAGSSAGPGIAGGLLEAIGVAALAVAVAAARSRRLLDTSPVPAVLVGLVLLAVSFVGYAV